jgi:hypothetical protein
VAIVFRIYEYNIYVYVPYSFPSHSSSGLDKKAGEGETETEGEGMKKKKRTDHTLACRVLFSVVFPLRRRISPVRRRPIFGEQKRRKEGDKGGR